MTRERIEGILSDAVASIFNDAGVNTEQVIDTSLWAGIDLDSAFIYHVDVLYKYVNAAIDAESEVRT